jgi:hypothetical protein
MENQERLTRKQLIEWLLKNDPQGIYTDQESIDKGLFPLTKKEAKNLVKYFIKKANLTT